jgi:hypothetical protein
MDRFSFRRRDKPKGNEMHELTDHAMAHGHGPYMHALKTNWFPVSPENVKKGKLTF